SGLGLQATVDDRRILVGNRALMTTNNVELGELETTAETLAAAGKTPMFVALDGRIAGVVAVADTQRASAAETITQLRALGIEPVMLTGDNARTAQAIARQLGIERVFADVLPADKATYIAQLQGEGKVVAMVGDGVNDAPAL